MGCTGASGGGCGCGCAKEPDFSRSGVEPGVAVASPDEGTPAAPATSGGAAALQLPDGSAPGPSAGGGSALGVSAGVSAGLGAAKGPFGGGGDAITAYGDCVCSCRCVPRYLNYAYTPEGIHEPPPDSGLSIGLPPTPRGPTGLPGEGGADWDWAGSSILPPRVEEGPVGGPGVPGYTYIGPIPRRPPDVGPDEPGLPIPDPLLSIYPVIGERDRGPYAGYGGEERVLRPPAAEGHRGMAMPRSEPVALSPPAMGTDGGPESIAALSSWVDEGTERADQVRAMPRAIAPDDSLLGPQAFRPTLSRAALAPPFSGDFEWSHEGGPGAGIGSPGGDPEVDNARIAAAVTDIEEAPEGIEATEDDFDADLDQDDGEPDQQTATVTAPSPERAPAMPPQVESLGGQGAPPAESRERAPLSLGAPGRAMGGSALRPSLVARPSARPSVGFTKGKTNAAFEKAVATDLTYKGALKTLAEKRHAQEDAEKAAASATNSTWRKYWSDAAEMLQREVNGAEREVARARGYRSAALEEAQSGSPFADQLWDRIAEEAARRFRREEHRVARLASVSGDWQTARRVLAHLAYARDARDRITAMSARLASHRQGDRTRAAWEGVRSEEAKAKEAEGRAARATDPDVRWAEGEAARIARGKADAFRWVVVKTTGEMRSPKARAAYQELKSQAKVAIKEAKAAIKEAKKAAKFAQYVLKHGSGASPMKVKVYKDQKTGELRLPRTDDKAGLNEKLVVETLPEAKVAELVAKDREAKAQLKEQAAEEAMKRLVDPTLPLVPEEQPAGDPAVPGGKEGEERSPGGACRCEPLCSSGETCVCQCLPPEEAAGAKGKFLAFSGSVAAGPAPASGGLQAFMQVPAAFGQQVPVPGPAPVAGNDESLAPGQGPLAPRQARFGPVVVDLSTGTWVEVSGRRYLRFRLLQGQVLDVPIEWLALDSDGNPIGANWAPTPEEIAAQVHPAEESASELIGTTPFSILGWLDSRPTPPRQPRLPVRLVEPDLLPEPLRSVFVQDPSAESLERQRRRREVSANDAYIRYMRRLRPDLANRHDDLMANNPGIDRAEAFEIAYDQWNNSMGSDRLLGEMVIGSIAGRLLGWGVGKLRTKLPRKASRGLPKPTVSDPGLQNAVKELYRPGAKIGTGSTADAIRHELATGTRVGGKSHIEKGEGWVRYLEKWQKKTPGASASDRAAAQAMLDDLRAALGGN